MNARTLAFWSTTALFALAAGAGGAADLAGVPQILEGLQKIGYPAYLATILGTWKILGVATVLAPGLPRLKEWAYAGFFFNLTGAAVSHVLGGDPVGNAVPPLFILAFGLASWALRPADRRLGTVLPAQLAAAA